MTSAYGKGVYGRGLYSGSINLAGAATPRVTFSATMANPVALAGDLPVTVTLRDAAVVSLDNLTGNLAFQIAINGLLAGAVNVGGDLPVRITMAASMQSGPPWGPSEQCDLVDWEESELCNG